MLPILLALHSLPLVLSLAAPSEDPTVPPPWRVPTLDAVQSLSQWCQLTMPQRSGEVQPSLSLSEMLDGEDRTAVAEDGHLWTYTRCLAKGLDLWSDTDGYNARRISKIFAKHRMPEEVIVVVDYCNQKHRNANRHQWAYETYKCATSGTMGLWMKDYLKPEHNPRTDPNHRQ